MTVPHAEYGNAEVGTVDEDCVEDGVGYEAGDGHVERGPGVLQAAEYPGRCEHDQHGRNADSRDPQVGGREGGCRVGGTEELHDRRSGGQDDGDDDGTEQQRQPDAVHALAYGGLEVSGSHAAGDGGRSGVGEEDEDADGRREKGGGDAEASELSRAQMSDDRAVGHDEERLGDERAEGRNGERDDLAVVLSPGGLGGS